MRPGRKDATVQEVPKPHELKAPTCPGCGVSISVSRSIHPGHCGSLACIVAHSNGAAAYERIKLRKAEANRVAARQHAGRVMPDIARALGTKAEKIADVPYQNRPVAPLSDERRADFLNFLATALPAAYDHVRQEPFIGPLQPPCLHPPLAIETAGCTACQGKCCAEAFDRRAFLSQRRFETLFRQNPQLTVQEATDTYVAALPEASVESACVYQSSHGCTLPRDWRADICNSYQCSALQALSKMAAPGTDMPMAIVGVGDVEVNILAYRESRGIIAVARVGLDGPQTSD